MIGLREDQSLQIKAFEKFDNDFKLRDDWKQYAGRPVPTCFRIMRFVVWQVGSEHYIHFLYTVVSFL